MGHDPQRGWGSGHCVHVGVCVGVCPCIFAHSSAGGRLAELHTVSLAAQWHTALLIFMRSVPVMHKDVKQWTRGGQNQGLHWSINDSYYNTDFCFYNALRIQGHFPMMNFRNQKIEKQTIDVIARRWQEQKPEQCHLTDFLNSFYQFKQRVFSRESIAGALIACLLRNPSTSPAALRSLSIYLSRL